MYGDLADRLQRVLTITGWSGRELAKRAGLKSVQHVNVMLRGRGSANVETIAAIAHAANVSFEWLGTGFGTPEVPRNRPRQEYQDFPAELVSAIGRRELSDVTLSALSAAKGHKLTEDRWRGFIDMQQASVDYLEMAAMRAETRAERGQSIDAVVQVAKRARATRGRSTTPPKRK